MQRRYVVLRFVPVQNDDNNLPNCRPLPRILLCTVCIVECTGSANSAIKRGHQATGRRAARQERCAVHRLYMEKGATNCLAAGPDGRTNERSNSLCLSRRACKAFQILLPIRRVGGSVVTNHIRSCDAHPPPPSSR